MHNPRVLFNVKSKSFEGTARIVDKYTDSKLAEEVSSLMYTNMDGVIDCRAPLLYYSSLNYLIYG